MLLPFPGERNIRGAARPPPPVLARHARPARPGRPRREREAGAQRPVRGLRPGRRPVGRPRRRRRVDADPHRRRGSAGSIAIAACGGSTPATGSPASARRPARSTPGPARSASRGTTRSASPGLDKVAPPSQAIPVLETRIAELTQPSAPVAEADDAVLDASLPALDAEVAAVRGSGRARAATGRGWPPSCATGEERLAAIRTPRRSSWAPRSARASDRLAALRAGQLDDPRLHLHHASEPEPPAVTRSRAFGEAWAALSVGLLIAALAVIVWFRILPPPRPSWCCSGRTSRSSRSSIATSWSWSSGSPSCWRSSRRSSSRSPTCASCSWPACSRSALLLVFDNLGEVRRRLRADALGRRRSLSRRLCCNHHPDGRAPPSIPPLAARGDPWPSPPLPAP